MFVFVPQIWDLELGVIISGSGKSSGEESPAYRCSGSKNHRIQRLNNTPVGHCCRTFMDSPMHIPYTKLFPLQSFWASFALTGVGSVAILITARINGFELNFTSSVLCVILISFLNFRIIL